MTTRIDRRFAELEREGRAALVTFLTAGDPDPQTSLAILRALPAAGADVVELGMPFTDPMADGPAIQAVVAARAQGRADAGETLAMVRAFRAEDDATPLVLMGYYNPIYVYGVERFLRDANAAGVDGLIVVDLPPEEDDELCLPALAAGLNFIRLATPTTDDRRLPAVLANTSGLRLLRLDHRHYRQRRRRTPPRSPRRSRASSATPGCRSRSASACAPPRRPPPSRRRRWRGGRLGAGERAQGEPRWRRQGDGARP